MSKAGAVKDVFPEASYDIESDTINLGISFAGEGIFEMIASLQDPARAEAGLLAMFVAEAVSSEFVGVFDNYIQNFTDKHSLSLLAGNVALPLFQESLGGINYQGGTEANDNLTGSSQKDIIFGRESQDLIEGYEGDDQLYGDEGNDTLIGGEGDDQLFGGKGDDLLVEEQVAFKGKEASLENNTFEGGEGNDRLEGWTGADTYIFNLGDGQDVDL